MNKWRKVLIGVVLLTAFALYTVFEKNAEPAWKVDEKSFNVVRSLGEGLKKESTDIQDLNVLNHYGLLQQVNKEIPLKKDLRTLRIEKVLSSEGRLYLLYSIDLKERDKSSRDIPTLTVRHVKISSENGVENTFPASINNDSKSGFVYKHRLYRSTYIIPQVEKMDEELWRQLSSANRYELMDIELIQPNHNETIQNLAFKISTNDIYNKVLETASINKKFTYGNQKEASLKAFEVLLNGNRLSIGLENDDDLVGFSGWYKEKSYPFTWDLYGTDNKGYSLIINNDYEELLQDDKDQRSFTLISSLHKEKESYSWKVPIEDIKTFNINKKVPINRNEKMITSQSNLSLTYKGLRLYNGIPTIQINVKQNQDPIDHQFLRAAKDFSGDTIPEEYVRFLLSNLLSISSTTNEQLENYTLDSVGLNVNEREYYLSFYKEDMAKGPITPSDIPEQDLIITISDLVYSKPLPQPVTIPYRIPKLKTDKNE
jgi:hypothetical protein